MDIEIRSIRAEEFEAWLRGMSKAFNEYPRDEWLEMERKRDIGLGPGPTPGLAE